MKSEILKSIRTSETEYKSMISTAATEKKKSISSAELEADNLILKAQAGAEEYRKLKIAEIRQQAADRHAVIVREGAQATAGMVEKGKKNIPRAVEQLVHRFKEQMHAKP
jgi:V/A-type H+-transporting ATPase subunit G/H